MFKTIQVEASVSTPKQLLLDMKVIWSSTYVMHYRVETNKKAGFLISCFHQSQSCYISMLMHLCMQWHLRSHMWRNMIQSFHWGWWWCSSNITSSTLACALSHINLAWNNVQLPTPHLSPYLNTNSLFLHGFPSFIQQSSSEQPSAHSLQSSCPTQTPLDPYLRIPWT